MLGILNDIQIDYLLHSEVVGRIGCSGNGLTYVVPVSYVYDGKSIFAHTHEGLKIELMRENPNVCFEIDRVENMANWQSVIVQGTYHELTGQKAEAALQALVNRMHPFATSETAVPRHGLDRPHAPIDPNIKMVVFEIKVKEKTGRFEKQ